MQYRFLKAVYAMFKNMRLRSLTTGIGKETRLLMKEMGLDWVAINYRNGMGNDGIVVAPSLDGTYPLKEVLHKRIPFSFLLILKLKHPRTPLFVRGLITKNEIRREMRELENQWGGDG